MSRASRSLTVRQLVAKMTVPERSRFVDWLGRIYCLDNGHDAKGTTCAMVFGTKPGQCDGRHETVKTGPQRMGVRS
jgi:hypothetical protein